MTPFFISYARMDHAPRVDPDERLAEFYEDLNSQVLGLLGAQWDNGFLDILSLGAGEKWDQGILDQLQTARVFIPLYTANYFNRPVCGQEWTVFRRRMAAFRQQFPADPAPDVVVPVLWMPEAFLPPRPAVASPLNYTLAQTAIPADQHRRLMETYRQYGIKEILTRQRLRKSYYADLIATLARTVATLAGEPELPPAAVPDLASVEDAFQSTGGGAGRGPRHVKFVYVAGARDDLKGIREELEAYGDDGLYWRPYRPDVDDEVSVIAQQVTSTQKFFYETVPLEATLQQVLAGAQARRNLAVLVVDPFALRLARFFNPVRACDARDDLTFLVMVPWNPADTEASDKRAELQQALANTFQKRASIQRLYLNAIPTADDFRSQLAVSLEWLRAFFSDPGMGSGGAASPASPRPVGGDARASARGLPVLSAAGPEVRP